jgi:hypothetical protein
MYVGTRKRWGMGPRLAGAHPVRSLGNLRGRKSLGFDWSSFSETLINAGAATAQVALAPTPPTFSTWRSPTGESGTQIYGGIPASLAAGSAGAAQLTNFITPNLLLFAGLGLVAVLVMSRK